jgi:hypothetical protein
VHSNKRRWAEIEGRVRTFAILDAPVVPTLLGLVRLAETKIQDVTKPVTKPSSEFLSGEK